MKTSSVTASCVIFSCSSVIVFAPIRLAGTATQYSRNAISHETRIATPAGAPDRLRKWPYQA